MRTLKIGTGSSLAFGAVLLVVALTPANAGSAEIIFRHPDRGLAPIYLGHHILAQGETTLPGSAERSRPRSITVADHSTPVATAHLESLDEVVAHSDTLLALLQGQTNP